MGDYSRIEWVDSTWNPARGCDKVSPGCKYCYAESFANRWVGVEGHPYEEGFGFRLVPDKLSVPLRWVKSRHILVGSMTDVFHEEMPKEFVELLFWVMCSADWHIFKVLTKRARRMVDFLEGRQLPGNIWLGVSCEDRKYGVPRIDLLRRCDAAVRFVSFEPLLEGLGDVLLNGVDWAIIGGETGPRSRVMKKAWVEDLIQQCRASDTRVFFKQWGSRNRSREDALLDGSLVREFPEFKPPRCAPAGTRRVELRAELQDRLREAL